MVGRRVEKHVLSEVEGKVDGYTTRYVHDGEHIIAEYDGNNNLLRKYIYGPGIDQPVSMIEAGDNNATYYYHFDALGSVVALSDSTGDTVQTYEYSVYGEVSASDPNHPNPYMFAGRRFDIEIGLYYNRARYYNPYSGRFLQTDPIGYGDGMNMYRYCKNNPLLYIDPGGEEITRNPADLSYMDPASDKFNYLLWRLCPQPSSWSIMQYFFWYRFADGAKINMEWTGLLSLFQADAQVQAQIAEFEAIFFEKAAAAWEEHIKLYPDPGDRPGFTFDFNDIGRYDFDGWQGTATIPEALKGNPLIVLGDGSFDMSGSLTAGPNGNWEVTFTYYVSDVFRDPNPLRKFNPWANSTEFEECTPYVIEGQWTTSTTGSFWPRQT